MSHRLGALLSVVITSLLGWGAAVFVTAAPAQAAGCSGSHGITVVVDFNQLGGTSVACAGGGGRSASSATTAAGFPLTYVQRSPGFVCRISGAPADSSCVNTPPATAYWGLFWNDGHGGDWVYASLGAGSLSVPDGGYVGWSWQGSSTRTTPGVTPVARDEPPAPTPTKTPTKSPTKAPTTPTKSPTAPSSASNATSSPSATTSTGGSPKASASPTSSAKPSASPTTSDSASVDAASTSPTTSETAVIADPGDPASGSGGLPGWAIGGIIAALLAGAATVTVVRRRGEHSP